MNFYPADSIIENGLEFGAILHAEFMHFIHGLFHFYNDGRHLAVRKIEFILQVADNFLFQFSRNSGPRPKESKWCLMTIPVPRIPEAAPATNMAIHAVQIFQFFMSIS